jgi:hypothetical protein
MDVLREHLAGYFDARWMPSSVYGLQLWDIGSISGVARELNLKHTIYDFEAKSRSLALDAVVFHIENEYADPQHYRASLVCQSYTCSTRKVLRQS